jgi:uncharacterized tellurite resistance protein B-like protein
MSILKFLGLDAKQPAAAARAPETETVRKIVQKLDRLPEDQARYIAAFAYLLSRASAADLDVTEEETAAMERLVMETQTQLFGGTENYLVTREFERVATREQKLALIECLFAVTATDADISMAEDNVVKQIASELKLSHSEYIAARSRFREHLSILKPGLKKAGESS